MNTTSKLSKDQDLIWMHRDGDNKWVAGPRYRGKGDRKSFLQYKEIHKYAELYIVTETCEPVNMTFKEFFGED